MMAKFYIDSFIGVKDGTKTPPLRADGRKVGATRTSVYGAKAAGVAVAIGDHIFIGTLRAGQSLRELMVTSDTSLGTATLTVGTLNAADVNNAKYANARTMTVLDTPTAIGPRATAAVQGPLQTDEDIWVTVGVAGIGAGVNLCFEMIIDSYN